MCSIMCSSLNADSTEPYLEGSNLLTGGKTYRKYDGMKYHKAGLKPLFSVPISLSF